MLWYKYSKREGSGKILLWYKCSKGEGTRKILLRYQRLGHGTRLGGML